MLYQLIHARRGVITQATVQLAIALDLLLLFLTTKPK
jgi:hypothetical protein